MANTPTKKWKAGGIQIACWDNEKGRSFSFKKSYKDKTTGEWKESKMYYMNDLRELLATLPSIISEGEPTKQAKAPTAPVVDDDNIPF